MEKNLNNYDILLVEDDLQIQKHFKEVFEYFFDKVYVASDGDEALEIFKEHNISAVFTDYMLPNMNGYELILELQKLDPLLPITIISNYTDKEKLQKCIPLGLMGYLFKPLSYEDIKKYLDEFSVKFLKLNKSIMKISKDSFIDFHTQTLFHDNNNFKITKRELYLLKTLINNKGRVVNYQTIFESIGEIDTSMSAIKNIVYRLKNKYNFDMIKNIKDIGYVLICDE